MHMARGGDAQGGGRGDARASCASPLGTPLDPDSIGSVDPGPDSNGSVDSDPDSESVSRRTKLTHKSRKNL